VAVEVVRLLEKAGLVLTPNPHFAGKRRPYVVPKGNWKRMDPTGSGKEVTLKKDFPEDPDRHVVCRCELVTETEVVDAIRRGQRSCLKVETTQQVRKRTRAGMGWCQGEYCESRVQGILARELQGFGGKSRARGEGTPEAVAAAFEPRPWPESSLLESQHQYADSHK